VRLRFCGVLAAAGLLLAGCGSSGPNAQSVLRQTAQNLGKIASGTLDLRLLVTPQGKGHRFGFTLHGPFSFGKTALPILDVAYTQIANGHQATATLISDGRRGVVQSNGATKPLSPSAESTLRAAGQQVQGAASLFDISSWLEHPKVSSGPAGTDEVTADLNVPNVANGLIGLLRLTGRNVQQLTSTDVKRLQNAVRSSSFVLYTGKKDRLLRKLDLTADLGFDVPQDLQNALGTLVGAKVEFELAVANPNKPVHVSVP
jgi:hypothetical protein